MNSGTVLAGNDGCTVMRFATRLIVATGAMSGPHRRDHPELGVNGRGSCGMRRCTSRILNPWTSSSGARAASTNAPLVLLGVWGDVKQTGREDARRICRCTFVANALGDHSKAITGAAWSAAGQSHRLVTATNVTFFESWQRDVPKSRDFSGTVGAVGGQYNCSNSISGASPSQRVIF
jgi:hypothetical protein